MCSLVGSVHPKVFVYLVDLLTRLFNQELLALLRYGLELPVIYKDTRESQFRGTRTLFGYFHDSAVARS